MTQTSELPNFIVQATRTSVPSTMPLFIVMLEYEYDDRTHQKMFDLANAAQLHYFKRTLAWCHHNDVTPAIQPLKITKAGIDIQFPA